MKRNTARRIRHRIASVRNHEALTFNAPTDKMIADCERKVPMSAQHAKAVMARMKRSGHKFAYPYLCQVCNRYHVTSGKDAEK